MYLVRLKVPMRHMMLSYVHMFMPVATCLDRGREGLWCKMTVILVGSSWEQLQSSERVLSLPERSREESWQRQPGQLIQPW